MTQGGASQGKGGERPKADADMGLLENMIGALRGPSDEELMKRVAAREDGDALEELMRRWQPSIQHLCERILLESHRAKDAAQEAFTRVYQKRKDFREGAKFSSFLRRVATNLCLDELRRAKRRRELGGHGLREEGEDEFGWEDRLPSPEPGPAERAECSELSEAVQRGVVRLPENLRVVVALKHYEGLTFREVAEALEIPEGTAKSRMIDALALLKKYLSLTQSTERPPCKIEAPLETEPRRR